MLLTQRYSDNISGVLSCFERVVIQGTLPTFCCADGMTGFLYLNRILQHVDRGHLYRSLNIRDMLTFVVTQRFFQVETT